MDTSRRRSVVRGSVAAGSVWESRMKSDEVKGGIFKAFDFEDDESNTNDDNNKKNESFEDNEKNPVEETGRKEASSAVALSGKRKTWKSENSDEKNPIQIARGKTDQSEDQCKKTRVKATKPRSDLKNCNEEQRKEIKKSPIQTKKGRSENFQVKKGSEKSPPVQVKKVRSESLEGNEKSPVQVRKLRSELSKGSDELCRDGVKSGDKPETNSVRLKKAEPELVEPVKANSDEAIKTPDGDIIEKEAESETKGVSDHPKEENDESVKENENNPDEIKELGVCQEKIISSSESNLKIDEQIDGGKEEEEKEEQEEETEGFDDDKKNKDTDEEEVDEEIEVEKKSIDVKELNVIKQKSAGVDCKIRAVNEVKRFHQSNNRAAPSSSTVNKLPPPVTKRATAVYPSPTKPSPSKASVLDEHQNFPQTQSRLQSLVDLVMWKDISKSTLIFGIGTFIIISSSYTSDLNISVISVTSYLGLVYLATIFVYRSVICRGFTELDERSYVVGEEEALWLLRLILPYFNESLLKLKALFSGDPATTMKLAVLLFVLARCGSSITIWKMAKLGFFGIFTVPKIFTSYSAQLTAYAKFWMRRFGDAWESCSHKKAVAFVIFIVLWNMSSVVARVWAAFMLFVAVQYYQQKIRVSDGWTEDDVTMGEAPVQGQLRRQRPERPSVPNNVNINLPNKLKKRS